MPWYNLLYYAAGILCGIAIGMSPSIAGIDEPWRLKIGLWALATILVLTYQALAASKH